MNKLEASQLISQMQQVAKQAAAKSTSSPSISEGNSEQFKSTLLDALNKVNSSQLEADKLTNRFAKGDPDVTMPEAMIALNKASISFQAVAEVRNKFVSAYQEIMNMSV